MTKPQPHNYENAAERIEAGEWRVDADKGLVYGVSGNPFVRKNSKGYIQIKFRDRLDWRREHAALAHRVIWEAVHGPLPDHLVINHINGDKADNRVANLEAVTMMENNHHARRTGLIPAAASGATHPSATLTADLVRTIYARAHAGENSASIARSLNVNHSTVRNIKCGQTWRTVTGHKLAA